MSRLPGGCCLSLAAHGEIADALLSSQEHRHSFVRKNAVMAVFTIYKNFDFLIPDAPELIQTFMAAVSLHHHPVPHLR